MSKKAIMHRRAKTLFVLSLIQMILGAIVFITLMAIMMKEVDHDSHSHRNLFDRWDDNSDNHMSGTLKAFVTIIIIFAVINLGLYITNLVIGIMILSTPTKREVPGKIAAGVLAIVVPGFAWIACISLKRATRPSGTDAPAPTPEPIQTTEF